MENMDPKYEALFTPWKIGNVEIKNRIVLCPMGGTSLFGWMEPNHFDREAADFFLVNDPRGGSPLFFVQAVNDLRARGPAGKRPQSSRATGQRPQRSRASKRPRGWQSALVDK
jgi:hypothetical protein